MSNFVEGKSMYKWMVDLFPIHRCLLGDGLRQTLSYIKKIHPDMRILNIGTGEKVFDWNVPNEWELKEAWIKDSKGNKIIDVKQNNLHILGYSESINKKIGLEELQQNLFSLPEQRDAIPYVTSYYNKNWGFCMTQDTRDKLRDEEYHVFIDSRQYPGFLNYGEVILPGETKDEVFFSTYICHPSMANNELSGPVVSIQLINFIKSLKKRKYTYRFIFIPETIGSIAYLSKNLKYMKKHVKAGFNLTCLGDDSLFSIIPSRNGSSLTDRIIFNHFNNSKINHKYYKWKDRGSDERQYCAPGIDLPVVTLCRSKFGEYDEYHTSLDNLNLISEEALQMSYNEISKIVISLEKNGVYKNNILGEPQLGKRGLYSNISFKGSAIDSLLMLDLLSFIDGELDFVNVCDRAGISVYDAIEFLEILLNENLISIN